MSQMSTYCHSSFMSLCIKPKISKFNTIVWQTAKTFYEMKLICVGYISMIFRERIDIYKSRTVLLLSMSLNITDSDLKFSGLCRLFRYSCSRVIITYTNIHAIVWLKWFLDMTYAILNFIGILWIRYNEMWTIMLHCMKYFNFWNADRHSSF